MRPEADPFLLPGDARGVLCLHGFTATPYNMRYIARELERRGMTVSAPRLPGHGTRVEDLAETTWHDWVAAVDAEVTELRKTCDRVAIVGQSLGGLLALYTAARRRDLDAVMTLAVPLRLYPWPTAVARVCKILPIAPTFLPKDGIDVSDKRLQKTLPTYWKFPVSSVLSMMELMGEVRSGLPRVECPVLVMHSRSDHAAPFDSATTIVREVGAKTVRLRAFERSFHLLSVDVDREAVAAEVATFAERAFSAPNPHARTNDELRVGH